MASVVDGRHGAILPFILIYNHVVDEISRRFCLPAMLDKTPAEERRSILERFHSGQYTKLVTGCVLNEGVDMPDCRVAIIVSGNSTRCEYIQRLGRVLRPKIGQALLYELVTSSTTEEKVPGAGNNSPGSRCSKDSAFVTYNHKKRG